MSITIAFTPTEFQRSVNLHKIKRGTYGNPGKYSCWVYFIRAGDRGPVKIGKTVGPVQKRLAQIQVGCPDKLSILSAVRVPIRHSSLEYGLHEVLSEFRIHGEWFRPAQRVLAYAFLAKANQGSAMIEMVWDQLDWGIPIID